MKMHRHVQGSAAWYEARLGKPTAYNFHKIITPKTAQPTKGKTRLGYLYKLAWETLMKETTETITAVAAALT